MTERCRDLFYLSPSDWEKVINSMDVKYVIVKTTDFLREPEEAPMIAVGGYYSLFEQNGNPGGVWQASKELAGYIPIRPSEISDANTASEAELKELTLEHQEVLLGLFTGEYGRRCGGVILRQGKGSNLPTLW